MNIEPSNTLMSDKQTQNSIPNLVFCAIACLAAMGFGGLFTPGEWYTQINIAPWSPPNIAFPIVWTILYICIAIAGWRIFNYGTRQLKIIWVCQLACNALWSWLFFGQHWVLIGLIDIALIIILVSLLIVKCWTFSAPSKNKTNLRLCSYLLVPYLMWLMVACSLNSYILIAN